jgi:asparagine synthetase B (glutamine-hydrolysing)
LYNSFSLSSFLAFRYVTKEGIPWKDGVLPNFPKVTQKDQKGVISAEEIIRFFSDQLKGNEHTGILLSAGIDSAILASFLPEGTRAYTVKFVADAAIDESPGASLFAERMNLKHKVVDVTWKDYVSSMDLLMKRKKSPLHAIEVALYKTALAARQDGINKLIVGNGADSTFGGMDKLLSKDWSFDEFMERYTFVKPSRVLKNYEDIHEIYLPYKTGDGIDVSAFLKYVHGLGIIQAFDNAIEAAGCSTIAPYESLFLDAPLDLARVRNNESKYILRKVFQKRFPDCPIPDKIPFARPMEQWLANWEGPKREEFLDHIDMKSFSGDQKWILFCLERFMDLFDETI